jgi:bacteriocin-like protein
MSEDNKEKAADNQKPSEEMSEEDLKQVAGGVENAFQNIEVATRPAKAVHKSTEAIDAYSKG